MLTAVLVVGIVEMSVRVVDRVIIALPLVAAAVLVVEVTPPVT